MLLLKKDDPRRKWRSVKRHTALLAKTFTFAAAITCVWYQLWVRGYHFPDDDKDILIGATITILGVAYSILVSWILSTILERYQKVVVSVLKQDKETFLLYRDERMLIAIHVLIGIVSVPLISMMSLVAYKHAVTGAVSVFSISLVIIAFWLVITLIENPTQSEWFRERIPGDWLDVDIDKYFHLGEGRKK
jgi:Kef-type K+ transport system membrane component KefB